MKKFLLLIAPLMLGLMVGCAYDDSQLRETIEQMQEEQDEMQEQLDAQQKLLDALNNKLTITSAKESADGYVITFSDGSTITVKDGEDGADGDSFFAEVVVGEDEVTFTLADGSVVIIPLSGGSEGGSEGGENNKIYYTTTDGKKLFPTESGPERFGAILVSNTYKDGQGVLVFDDTVTLFGEKVFNGCSTLASVTIPDGVTSIGYGAFSGCSSLTEFKGKFTSEDGRCLIIDGVLNWFAPAGLTEYTIPDSVTSIGERAFYYCSSLTSITIPDSVTSIGEYAFSGCTGELIINSKIVETDYTYTYSPSEPDWLKGANFTTLTIGDSVTSIGNYAFYDCSSLTSVTIGNSVTSIGDYAFYNCSSLTSVTIPDGVTSIGYQAFYGCSSLTSVTIGNGVTEIGDMAFYNCSSLTSITIPDGVTSIGDGAFAGCTSLPIEDNVRYADTYLVGVVDKFQTSYTIKDGTHFIGSSAFEDCSRLTSITIPDGVTSIGGSAFDGCKSLASINIPDSVTSIGGRAFYDCSSLESVTIPDSVTSIGSYAFRWCTSLASVTIGNSVTEIGEYAFCDCRSLRSVYCKPTTPPSGGYNMFSYDDGYYYRPIGCKIYVPTASVEAYKAASYWSNYASAIVGYEF